MKRYKINSTVLVIVFGLIFFWGCNQNKKNSNSIEKETLAIGAILPLTGNSSFLGEAEKKGIELALKEIKEEIKRENIDVDIKVIYEDSKNESKEAINAFNKLINFNEIDAAIVTHSGVCGPISEYIRDMPDEKVPPLIGTIVASTKITYNNREFFRLYPSGIQEALPMAEYAYKELGLRSIVIFYQNDDYGLDASSNFKTRFIELGGSIIETDAFDKTSNNHRDALTKLTSKKMDGIYVIGNTPAYSLALKQLREIGVDAVVMSGSALMVPSLRKAAAGGENETIFTSTLFDIPRGDYSKEAEMFANSFENSFESPPNFLHAFTYTSLHVIFDAYKSSLETKQPLSESLKSIDGYPSPIGTIYMGEDREADVPIAIQKFNENGELNFIKIHRSPKIQSETPNENE